MQYLTSTAEHRSSGDYRRLDTKGRDASSSHRTGNRDTAPVPRIPAVEDLSLLCNVGVLLLDCTTVNVHTSRLA